ncbi:MAG: hypothetical protein K6F89_00505 [Prevotella sp.]|nr:hypothetical protein [Prevotella sp.]
MKTYIKPNTKITLINIQPLLGNSVASVSGLDGVTKSSGDFAGGAADSRGYSDWDDDEDDF